MCLTFKRVLMPDRWINLSLRKDYVIPDFNEFQDAFPNRYHRPHQSDSALDAGQRSMTEHIQSKISTNRTFVQRLLLRPHISLAILREISDRFNPGFEYSGVNFPSHVAVKIHRDSAIAFSIRVLALYTSASTSPLK